MELRPVVGLLYQPWMIDGDDCRAVSGMNAWQGKPKYSEKTHVPANMTSPGQDPGAAAVGSRRLTA
jgi:hypothetical protein